MNCQKKKKNYNKSTFQNASDITIVDNNSDSTQTDERTVLQTIYLNSHYYLVHSGPIAVDSLKCGIIQ